MYVTPNPARAKATETALGEVRQAAAEHEQTEPQPVQH